MDKISIVIPCFNDHKYVEESIKSAVNQSYSNKEIIVVDDGSNLKTKTVLKKLKPYIDKLLIQNNMGVSSARNVGINQAQGDYVLVQDSDDFFDPTFCEKAIKLFENDNNIKLVSSFMIRFGHGNQSELIKYKEARIQDFLKYNHTTGSAMFRKMDFKMAGGYDENMKNGFEDWEFYIRILKNGGYSAIIPEPLFKYRQKAESTSTKANKIKYDLLQYIYIKHKNLYTLYFEDFISHILERLESIEKAEQKNLNKIDYKIGELILSPFRIVRKIFKIENSISKS